MYEVSVERCFSAAHAITIHGRREATHGHNWTVKVVVSGDTVDANGLLVDFHLLEKRLSQVIDRFRDADLNTVPPFDEINPTAEHVAKHIADTIAPLLADRVRLSAVSVTEAPGCTALYRL